MKVIYVSRAEVLIRELLNTICKNNALLLCAAAGEGANAARLFPSPFPLPKGEGSMQPEFPSVEINCYYATAAFRPVASVSTSSTTKIASASRRFLTVKS